MYLDNHQNLWSDINYDYSTQTVLAFIFYWLFEFNYSSLIAGIYFFVRNVNAISKIPFHRRYGHNKHRRVSYIDTYLIQMQLWEKAANIKTAVWSKAPHNGITKL